MLEWLNKYTFVEEQRFADAGHAERNAVFFMDELLRNGTTTAVVYATVHPGSVEAFFAELEPARYRDDRGQGHDGSQRAAEVARYGSGSVTTESRALIERWHGKGRQRYAVTPRFAITSTEAQLEAAGALKREHSGVYMQTHLSENPGEIETVRQLFPDARHYTDVYDRYGLLGERSLFGHCVHLEDDEVRRLSESRSVAVFCPTSESVHRQRAVQP